MKYTDDFVSQLVELAEEHNIIVKCKVCDACSYPLPTEYWARIYWIGHWKRNHPFEFSVLKQKYNIGD